MLRPAPILLLLASALSAQVLVTAVPMSPQTTRTVLNSRIASKVMLWTVTLENQSGESVSVAEAAVLRRMPQVRPFDHTIAAAMIADGDQYSLLARLARLAGDGSAAAGFLGTGKVLPMTTGMNIALAGAAWAFPYAATRLKGIERPAAASYQLLSWASSITLAPNGAALTHIFSEPWTTDAPIAFILDTSKAPTSKALQ